MVDALNHRRLQDAARYWQGRQGRARRYSSAQLGATVLRAAGDRTGINTADVDDIIWGTSSQRGPQSGDLGRMSRSTPVTTCVPAVSRWTGSAVRASPASIWRPMRSCRVRRIS